MTVNRLIRADSYLKRNGLKFSESFSGISPFKINSSEGEDPQVKANSIIKRATKAAKTTTPTHQKGN